MLPHNKRLIFLLGLVVVLLLIPLIAMQFTNEVNWNGFDFVVMGGLLLVTVLLIELVIRMVRNGHSRVILIAIILLVLLLIWAELAVGIFETPFAGN